jgi:prophage maintenance system killer protein
MYLTPFDKPRWRVIFLNKRVAFAYTAIFLRMNGYRPGVDPDDGESFLFDRTIQWKIAIEEIAAWLENATKK